MFLSFLQQNMYLVGTCLVEASFDLRYVFVIFATEHVSCGYLLSWGKFWSEIMFLSFMQQNMYLVGTCLVEASFDLRYVFVIFATEHVSCGYLLSWGKFWSEIMFLSFMQQNMYLVGTCLVEASFDLRYVFVIFATEHVSCGYLLSWGKFWSEICFCHFCNRTCILWVLA